MREKPPFPAGPEFCRNSQESSGFDPENRLTDHSTEDARERPLSLEWITDDLLQYTQDVWSKAYGREVSEDEAVEILLNVKRLAELMTESNRQKGGAKDERGDLGEGFDA